MGTEGNSKTKRTMADMCMGSISLISNVIAMAGTWIHFSAHNNGEAGAESCDVVNSVGLWFNACRRVYCPNAVTYACGRFVVDPVPQEWQTTQAFVVLALIFSIFGAVGSCSECGPNGRKSLAFIWVTTMISGITAMSVWTEFHNIGTDVGVWFTFSAVFGGGYIFCIVGWIFAFFAAICTYTNFDTDSTHDANKLQDDEDLR
eukprot:gb/GEZN01011426.1/.p1 GENE.gb/GEZN01011426.1/~~gb/GEZN01011426.1/.p1  ORF type:complete len:203 (-),score=12.65 gb/GEZN01011426.1/:453-1061(-)